MKVGMEGETVCVCVCVCEVVYHVDSVPILSFLLCLASCTLHLYCLEWFGQVRTLSEELGPF